MSAFGGHSRLVVAWLGSAGGLHRSLDELPVDAPRTACGMSAQFCARPQCINMQPGLLAAVAAGACSTITGEAQASPGRAGRAAGVAAQAGDDPDRHRGEHALHPRPHVVNADRLDPVIPQEPGYPDDEHPRSPDRGEFPRRP